jgi:trimethylamine:corrinoid methyltransferase-like protein
LRPVVEAPLQRLHILTPADLERLDAATLEVLATTGIAVPCAAAREAAVAAGARAQGERLVFPPGVTRELVCRAPRHFTLGARDGRHRATGDGTLITTDGCPTEIHDLDSGERRATTAADVAAIARLADALDEVDFCWPAVSAQDRPVERRGLHELYLALANTGKHVQTVTVVEPVQARVAVEIARLVAGGEREAREHPPLSALLGTVTPLGNDEGTLEAALVFAAAGIPIGFVTMPMGGSTTPITMAGSLVVAMAEALAGVALVQAAHPGAPVFVSFIPSIMDLQTGDFTGGAPEDTLMGAAVGDIGAFYGLPTQCGVNASSAKAPGWQTAMEDVTTTFVSMMAGVDLLTGVGMLAAGRVFSFAEMLLGAEIAGLARVLISGATSRASGGARLGLLRDGPPEGVKAHPDVSVEARERVRVLLSAHRPPPLDEALDVELQRLVEGGG